MSRLVSTLIWMEGVLAVAGLTLLVGRMFVERLTWHQIVRPTWHDTLWGATTALIMLGMSVAGSAAAERWAWWGFLKRWIHQFLPLLTGMRARDMVLLSVIAGVGEEALFRGVIQSVLGVWFASLLFAVMHVFRWDSDGLKMTAFYIPFGLLLGWLYATTQNLWGCIVAHTLYDLVALWWLRRSSYHYTPTQNQT